MDEVLLEGPSTGELITFIHGWPDDLHLWDDLCADLLATNKYRTCRITMPGYGDKHGKHGNKVIDPNFHQVAQSIAEIIRHNLLHPNEKSILICHDWGAAVGIVLQRLHSNLFSRLVVCDIGPIDHSNVFGMIGMGLYYQWINSFAYWLWRYVPLFGEPLGNLIHQFQVRRFKKFPDGRPHPRTNFQQSASAAYFYHYFQANFFIDDFLPFSLRGGSPLPPPPSDKSKNPSVPTLFLHGDNKASLGRFFKPWMKELHKREDCDVCVLPGDHWFMLWSPKETSEVVIKWLNNGGKLDKTFKAKMLSNSNKSRL